MNTARKPAPGPVPRIRSWRYRMADHDLHRRVEVSDDGRTLATAEVTTGGPGGTAGPAAIPLRLPGGRLAVMAGGRRRPCRP